MDSDHEDDHDDGQGNEERSGARSATLTGFLFGNVNKKGELEDDVLDEDAKRHITGLNALGMGTMVQEITTDSQKEDSDKDDSADESIAKSDNAVDYSNETEMADEEEEQAKMKSAMATMKAPTTDGDDYDEEDGPSDKKDSQLMPPPAWIPDTDGIKTEIKTEDGEDGSAESKINAPLAAMLPPELRDKDCREWFPEFRPGQVLRFSRLFKPMYTPSIYKKKKKKKGDDDETSDQRKEENMETDESGENGDAATDSEDYWPFKLNMGRKPRPEELAEDDADRLVADEKPKDEVSNTDEKGEGKPSVAAWRYGPAQLWYDMLGVDETGEGFDYGFRLKQEGETQSDDSKTDAAVRSILDLDGGESPLEPEMQTERKGMEKPEYQRIDYPDEAFHMVTQIPWEEEVIWNGEDVRQKILQASKTKGAMGGWIPSSSARTAQQYIQQTSGKNASNLSSSSGPGGRLGTTPAGTVMAGSSNQSGGNDDANAPENWYNIFPVENQELLFGRWEDDIIWDSENMSKIPEPTVPTLDPNDDNIILEIPDDKEPNSESKETQSNAKKEKSTDCDSA